MIDFEYINLNPRNKITDDCAVRAVAKAMDDTYINTSHSMYRMSLETGWTMHDKRLVEKFVKSIGFIKLKQPRKSDGKLYKVNEIDELVKPDDVVLVRLKGHMTVIKNLVNYDIWDCRDAIILNYYILKRGEGR